MGFSFGGGEGRRLSKWEEGQERRRTFPGVLEAPERAAVSPSPRAAGSVSGACRGCLMTLSLPSG